MVVAPDSFGGVLSAPDAAHAIAAGWHRERPDDAVDTVPMSDGGEGLLDVVHRPQDRRVEVEVCGPLGLPTEAWFSLRDDGAIAVVESAQACGLHLVPSGRRSPLDTTTYGVGQLLEAAREAGASRILVGLGGSATVDGGAGALTGLGFRLRVADGSGLKIGGRDLHRVARAEQGWVSAEWEGVEVMLLADVRTTLHDAPGRFGPQKGADDAAVELLADGLRAWAEVAQRDLATAPALADLAGSGAAGGLGFGLAAGLGASFTEGADAVAGLVGLDAALEAADLVVTGEGRLDATSFDGKVVGAVVSLAQAARIPVAAIVGRDDGGVTPLDHVLTAAADGPEAARQALAAAGRRLARIVGR